MARPTRPRFRCPGCERMVMLPIGVDAATAEAADLICHQCQVDDDGGRVNEEEKLRAEAFELTAVVPPRQRARDAIQAATSIAAEILAWIEVEPCKS